MIVPGWGSFVVGNVLDVHLFTVNKMTIYCLKCKKPTETHDRFEVTTSNGRRRRGGTCAVCGARKSKFVTATGAGIMNKIINRLPVEMHLPGHNFTGPGTKLHKRLRPDGTPKGLVDAN